LGAQATVKSSNRIRNFRLGSRKTGQVLVRTSRHPSVPKIESNQLQKLAMSGAL